LNFQLDIISASRKQVAKFLLSGPTEAQHIYYQSFFIHQLMHK